MFGSDDDNDDDEGDGDDGDDHDVLLFARPAPASSHPRPHGREAPQFQIPKPLNPQFPIRERCLDITHPFTTTLPLGRQ